MPILVLASASPRRRELLAGLGLTPPVRPVDLDETPRQDEPAADCVLRLARAKAEADARPGELVLAADTLVVLDGRILGKPTGPEQARRMLADLAGRDHLVMTGVAVRDADAGRTAAAVETTRVTIGPLTAASIAAYVATGEPLDKAGAYAIQGLGALFVERVDGNYSNVVGLPLPLTARLVAELGYGVGMGEGIPLDTTPPRHYLEAMTTATTLEPRAYIVFTGTGPILVLSTYGDLKDERLLEKLRYKGISSFIAYQVDLQAVRKRYEHSYENIAEDLATNEDIRVLDFNGHQIMANFSLEQLGDPIKYG